MIAVGEIVSIGAGTTTIQVARSLRHRKHLTIITTDLNVAMELSHRSVYNFFVNLIAGLVAYTLREKKPSLHLRDRHLLPAVL